MHLAPIAGQQLLFELAQQALRRAQDIAPSACFRNSRLSTETMPRSMTQMRLAWPYLLSIAATISLTVVTSLRLPANTS
jgi:hypothetical protein